MTQDKKYIKITAFETKDSIGKSHKLKMSESSIIMQIAKDHAYISLSIETMPENEYNLTFNA